MCHERRLEDRIRKLCAGAVVAGSNEFNSILAELRAALHEQTERLRARAAASTFRLPDGFPTERRAVVITRGTASSGDVAFEANAVESDRYANCVSKGRTKSHWRSVLWSKRFEMSLRVSVCAF